jgi:hypothetical protein
MTSYLFLPINVEFILSNDLDVLILKSKKSLNFKSCDSHELAKYANRGKNHKKIVNIRELEKFLSSISGAKMLRQASNLKRNSEYNTCCVCTSKDDEVCFKITENFVKIESRFIPIRDIIFELKLLVYDVSKASNWRSGQFQIYSPLVG